MVARGGYSGIFPDHTSAAYLFANAMSMSDVVLLCDLQLTSDGVGICRSDLRLENSTNIADVLPGAEKTYKVNGIPLRGWFAVDFTAEQIFSNLTGSSRASRFSLLLRKPIVPVHEFCSRQLPRASCLARTPSTVSTPSPRSTTSEDCGHIPSG